MSNEITVSVVLVDILNGPIKAFNGVNPLGPQGRREDLRTTKLVWSPLLLFIENNSIIN